MCSELQTELGSCRIRGQAVVLQQLILGLMLNYRFGDREV